MKTSLTTAAHIVVSTSEKATGWDDQQAAIPDSQAEIVTLQRIRKLLT